MAKMFDALRSVEHAIVRSHPEFGWRALELEEYLTYSKKAGFTKTLFKAYESFRSFERQDYLFAKGSTKARGGQSAHNYGLACDFVPYLNGQDAAIFEADNGGKIVPGWSWHPRHDYGFLQMAARKFGLEAPIPWDLVHVQLPNWKKYVK